MTAVTGVRFEGVNSGVAGRMGHMRETRFSFVASVLTWVRRHEERRALAELDDRMLTDLGIDRDAAAQEIAKPFWRA